MIIANFTCPKCRAMLDLENVDEGQLVDCPQCKTPFEIPRKKQVKIGPKDVPSKIETSPQPKPPAIPKPQIPPYPNWSVAANFFAGICLLSAFCLLMAEQFSTAIQAVASSVAFALTAFLIKVLCDIRWHLERISKI